MNEGLFKFVWRHSRREQIIILALTVVSFPLVYLSLELPKIIINDAIGGAEFPVQVFNLDFYQTPYLLLLCGSYLGLIVIINALKWLINVSSGMTGERMLRRLRFSLFELVLRFKMRRFRKTRPGEIVQSLLGEIEPLGNFVGEVVSTPAFQGGLLCVYALFIFMQDVWLGLAAIAIYPIQGVLISRMQAEVIRLNRERALNTRALADGISESVSLVPDMRTNDTARWHLARIAGRLHTNTMIRLALFRRKFTIKFVNNFLNHLMPFFFFAVGGYLVIDGQLDIGALVAVLAAYKEMAAPWKALLGFSQRWTDFSSRYALVMDSFADPDEIQPAARFHGSGEPALIGTLVADSVVGGPGTGGLRIEHLQIAPGETVAVVGGASGARDAALRLMAGLLEPEEGRIAIGGCQIADATLAQLGAALAFVPSEPGMVAGTLRENLVYGLLRSAPAIGDTLDPAVLTMLREARRCGNPEADPSADWVDYAAVGLSNVTDLEIRLSALTSRFGLAEDLVAAALKAPWPPAGSEKMAAQLAEIGEWLKADGLDVSDIIEPWQQDRFNPNAHILANLLFADLPDAGADPRVQLGDARVAAIISKAGANRLLEEIGWDIACAYAGIVDSVGEGSSIIESFSSYARAAMREAAPLVAARRKRGLAMFGRRRRRVLRTLAAGYVDMRDRLDVITPERIGRLIEVRGRARALIGSQPGWVAFDRDQFNPSFSLASNIFKGAPRIDRRAAWARLDQRLVVAAGAVGLADDLQRLALSLPLADAGLSTYGIRRLALIRAILKRPAIVILDGVADGEDEASRALRAELRSQLPESTVIYAAATDEAAKDADRILAILEDGTLIEADGPGGRRRDGGAEPEC